MVTVFSNTNSEPACLVSRLKFGNDNNVDNVQFQRLGWLIPQRGKKSISEKMFFYSYLNQTSFVFLNSKEN